MAAAEKVFEMTKATPEGGRITVVFHVYEAKAHVITLGNWRGAGGTAFTLTLEEARTEWTRLRKAGFKYEEERKAAA